MTRRKLMAWLLLLLLVGVGGTYGVLWLTKPTPGFTEENALGLRRGMTLKQVEELFGLPGVPEEIGQRRRGYYWHERGRILVQAVFTEVCHLISAVLALPSSEIGLSFGQDINVNESFLDWLRRILRLLD